MKKVENTIENDKANVEAMLSSNAASAQKGFNELYKRHKESIFFVFLKNMGFNEELAEDLTQETFSKVFENIDKYNSKFAFSTWLYRIARNVLIDYKRQDKCEVLSLEGLNSGYSNDEPSSEKQFQLEDKAYNNHDLLVRSERKTMVHNALNALRSDDSKRIMTLMFLEEKTYDEVAELMGMPIGTVKAVSVRAKTEMHSYITRTNKDFEYGRICTKKFVKVVEELEEA